jgi:ectoine hydroxylase-related dioxygenase (phytanoyl-CoA dioxygenase family)
VSSPLASMRGASTIVRRVAADGWTITPPIVPFGLLDELVRNLSPLLVDGEARGGIRHLLDVPSVRRLARADAVREAAESVLGAQCFAVRGILFDKSAGANWKVIWHQDLTIAVRERRDVPEFGPWTEKEGVLHVQPTVDVLERMLAVRVHLDECGPENGPVRVISGSHRHGRLSASAIDEWKSRGPIVDCTVDRGGILAFRPLVLHASSAAAQPAHRRVVHLEFAAGSLPGGLEWYHRV